VTIPVNEVIKFVNEHSQLVLEIEGEATTEGTRADQYTDTGGDHQRWRVKPAGPGNTGFYTLENANSDLCLEVVNSSTHAGAEIVQRSYGTGPPHRQWTLLPVAGTTNTYKIENRNSGLVLDDEHGRTDAPAPVKQYASWTGPDRRQQWTLIPATTTRTAWAWGANTRGQLGDGTTTDRSAPVVVQRAGAPLSGVKTLAAGFYHRLALMEDGTVLAWGSNAHGELGDGTTTDRSTPVVVQKEGAPLTGVKTLAAGTSCSLALMEDGTVLAWGLNASGQLGDGSTTDRSTPVVVQRAGAPLTGVKTLAAGHGYSLALLEEGTVLAWGRNDRGQLGDGTTTDRTMPVVVQRAGAPLSGVKTLAAGAYHGLALLEDGTVLAWGLNAHGELGDGTTTDRSTPVAVQKDGAPLTGVKTLAAGHGHSLVL
jgi:ricin-type beta-trefoil lectin protein/regulator of chromosome condensation (RCC1) repeat-containing protein